MNIQQMATNLLEGAPELELEGLGDAELKSFRAFANSYVPPEGECKTRGHCG